MDALDALSGYRCWYMPVFRQWVSKPPDTFWSKVPYTEETRFFSCRRRAWLYTRRQARFYGVLATLYSKGDCSLIQTVNYANRRASRG